jgi:hypothetical protein
MTERFDISPEEAEEDLMEISRDLEQAWRVITRPQEYSRYKVKKAEDLLDSTKFKILASIDMATTDEEIAFDNNLMLGFYHYYGTFVMPDSPERANLN